MNHPDGLYLCSQPSIQEKNYNKKTNEEITIPIESIELSIEVCKNIITEYYGEFDY